MQIKIVHVGKWINLSSGYFLKRLIFFVKYSDVLQYTTLHSDIVAGTTRHEGINRLRRACEDEVAKDSHNNYNGEPSRRKKD